MEIIIVMRYLSRVRHSDDDQMIKREAAAPAEQLPA